MDLNEILLTISGRLLRHPASPYHETAVRAEVERICEEYKLSFKRDAFGNVLVRLQTAPKLRPFVLAAHMDHPGFEVIRLLKAKTLLARFLGGVGDAYFQPGVPVRLMPGALPGRLGNRVGKKREFKVHADIDFVEVPEFAVWELEDFALRDGKVHARSCDDLIGVASILATMIALKQSRARVNVIGVISRAEEVGFHGALTVAVSRQLPKKSLIISLETSRELPPAEMGRGVILRVGDRTSIFDSAAMRFLAEVAGDLQRRDPSFQFQRALMYGGTCEATAYQEFGFQTGAVCVALGNYHNCGPENKIAAEYVSLSDASTMVKLLTACAKEMKNFERGTGKLPARLKKMLKEAEKKLRPRRNKKVAARMNIENLTR